ncbi:hypothetical protein SNE40_008298 [Patella caerulea]|uniref:Pacifastin domain-containing protein n=1 Tax=Patella caerulea TaxID=87958 RepID=A0AAN8K107_PATCE
MEVLPLLLVISFIGLVTSASIRSDGAGSLQPSDGQSELEETESHPGQCLHKGVWHDTDKSFQDDCNTCGCNEDGLVWCTLMLCN